jgi:threonine dehydratase
MVTIDDIYAARVRLPAEILRTPLLFSEALSREASAQVWLKAESLQVTGSYKARAAFTILDRMPPEARARGAALSSSGNFAQAFAYMGRLLGVPTALVMMENTSPLKVARTRAFGGEVVLCGNDFQERWNTLSRLEQERGMRAVNHFEDADVIAGHGTIGLELLEQLPAPDAVLVPVSSGGLIAGVATAIKTLRPATRVIGIQPEGSNAMHASRAAGRVIAIPAVRTICDALTAQHPGELPFAHLQAYVDDMILVTDDAVKQAIAFLLEHAKLVVEPGGAVGVAALLSGRVRETGSVVALVSGGNIDRDRLVEYIGAGRIAERE